MDESANLELLNEEFGLELSIEEMQRSLDAQLSGIDAMKSTARTIFGSASLIIAIIGAFHLTDIYIDPRYLYLYNLGIAFSMILYIIVIILCILILVPVSVAGPVDEDWEVLYSSFIDKSRIEILSTRLSAYINAIDMNRKIIDRLNRFALISGSLLPIIVIVLLLLNLIPRQAQP